MTPAIGSEVWLERRKWPDAPHYGVRGTVLGADAAGVWVGAHAGSTIVMPDGSERLGERRAVWFVPADDWYLVHFWDGHPEVAVYVDICTPPAWNERGMRTVDLDFDVIRWTAARGGGVELVDADEFEEHRVALAYPDDLVAAARRAADDVFERVRSGEVPFTPASAEEWLVRLG